MAVTEQGRADQPASRPQRQEAQRATGEITEEPLIDALAALYAYVYGTSPDEVRRAAGQRALAMRYSDRWVSQGCDVASPLVAEVRAALVRSYAALLSAVHRL